VVMVGGGDELLAAHEPRGLAMAHLLGHLRKRKAYPSKPLDRDRIGGSLHDADEVTLASRIDGIVG